MVTTRLEESSEGPARKYYRATAEGGTLTEEMEAYFSEMTGAVIDFQRADFTQFSSGILLKGCQSKSEAN